MYLLKTAAVAFWAFIAVPVVPLPEEGVALRWRLEKNRPFLVEIATETTQTITVMNQEIQQKQNQSFLLRFSPQHIDAEGNWVVAMQFTDVKATVEIGQNKVVGAPGAAPVNPWEAMMRALSGKEIRLVLSPKLSVLRLEGHEDLIKELVGAHPQMQAITTTMLSEASIKHMVSPVFDDWPTQRVKPLDTWSRTSHLDLGSSGKFSTTKEFTYEGMEKNLDKIRARIALKHRDNPAPNQNGLPFAITKSDLNSTEGKGWIYFDRSKGQLDRAASEISLKGRMVISIGGQDTEVNLEQQQKTTYRVIQAQPAP